MPPTQDAVTRVLHVSRKLRSRSYLCGKSRPSGVLCWLATDAHSLIQHPKQFRNLVAKLWPLPQASKLQVQPSNVRVKLLAVGKSAGENHGVCGAAALGDTWSSHTQDNGEAAGQGGGIKHLGRLVPMPEKLRPRPRPRSEVVSEWK